MPKGYVEQRNGGLLRRRNSRILGLGQFTPSCAVSPPKWIAESFPALNLEQVYGSIAFYLAHRERIDEYLQEGKAA